MKKNLLTLASALFAFGSYAQLPVSTTPENRNALLEEFTGIYCQFCPDGHKRANDLAAANPGDVFLINIHTGGFAVPGAGDPDFRTQFGDAIAAQSGLTGYPAGTINRHLFPGMQQGTGTAMSRGDWATAAGQIIGQSSYVNVALEADIDVASRVMTIDLEAYFTANGASSVNINVAVTQSNVEGPQTGGSTYYPAMVLPNGNYNHNHMLRHLVTGQWGDVVTTTTMGTTVTKQYTWTIPMDINGVPVEIGDLEVVAFIVEGQQEVITANDGPISFTVPPGTILVDLKTANQTSAPSNYCASSISPQVYITNTETAACSGYKVGYSLDGGPVVYETVNTPLAGGASVSHTFAPATISGGAHTLTFTIETTASNELEIVTGNNSSASPTFYTVEPTAVTPPKSEGFESATASTWPTGVYPSGDLSNFQAYSIAELSSSSTQAIGGYGQSDRSIFFYFWNNQSGVSSSVFFDKVNLAGKESATMTMDHAFTTWGGTNDKLEVFVSSDCGVTWNSVWVKSGSGLATAPELNSNNQFFIPTNTQWVTDTISLNDYIGDEIIVRLVGTSDFGDCLYVDNVNINGITVGVEELFNSNELSVYPNPASDRVMVYVNSEKSVAATISLVDLVGKVVYTLPNSLIGSGNSMITIPTESISSGVYFLTIQSSNAVSTERVVIQH
jgi:hypothetical protein